MVKYDGSRGLMTKTSVTRNDKNLRGFFFHVTCIISQQNLLLCVIWILGIVLVMKAMCYTLLKCWIYFTYQLLHVKKNTTSVIHTIVVKWVFFYVKRQLIVNSSQNFLTYLSGENMGATTLLGSLPVSTGCKG